MIPRTVLEGMFRGRGFDDFRWIDPASIVVAEWVRMKCLYGCGDYGRNACCPPNVPPVPECGRFFREYDEAVLFHFAKTLDRPEDRHAWTREISGRLIDLERDVFRSGHPKAFMLLLEQLHALRALHGPPGVLQGAAAGPADARALAVDVYTTVRAAGYPIRVLADYAEEMNRYAILLVD